MTNFKKEMIYFVVMREKRKKLKIVTELEVKREEVKFHKAWNISFIDQLERRENRCFDELVF